jgi:hypothetical protein
MILTAHCGSTAMGRASNSRNHRHYYEVSLQDMMQ